MSPLIFLTCVLFFALCANSVHVPTYQGYQGGYRQAYQPAYQQTYQTGYTPQAAYSPEPQYAIKKPLRQSEKEQQQDFNKIPGIAGKDYPLYHEAPHTGFSCKNVPAHPGIYADVESGCQSYHVCHDGREGDQGATFLCTNGTIFNQKEFTCDWWYNVNCHDAPTFYSLNADPATNPYAPKPKPQEEEHANVVPHNNNYYPF